MTRQKLRCGYVWKRDCSSDKSCLWADCFHPFHFQFSRFRFRDKTNIIHPFALLFQSAIICAEFCLQFDSLLAVIVVVVLGEDARIFAALLQTRTMNVRQQATYTIDFERVAVCCSFLCSFVVHSFFHLNSHFQYTSVITQIQLLVCGSP